MTRLRFYCDSGANIASCRTEEIDVERELGLTFVEWEKLSDEKKLFHVMEWANNYLEIGWEAI